MSLLKTHQEAILFPEKAPLASLLLEPTFGRGKKATGSVRSLYRRPSIRVMPSENRCIYVTKVIA